MEAAQAKRDVEDPFAPKERELREIIRKNTHHGLKEPTDQEWDVYAEELSRYTQLLKFNPSLEGSCEYPRTPDAILAPKM